MVSYGVLACLLAVLTVIPQPANGQLNQSESSTNNTSWSCARWYNRLEEALVADEEIIHQLQDTFFPVSGRAPFSLVVVYDLSNGTEETVQVCQGWSSSAVLSVIHRSIIMHWQPFLEAVFTLQRTLNFEPVHISLSVGHDMGVLFPDPELECAIMKLTGWLRAYAEYRGKPQKWEERNKGFIWEWEGTSITDILVIIATLAMQILLQLYLMRNFLTSFRQCLEQETLWSLCVSSAGECLFVFGVFMPLSYVITLFFIGNITITLFKIFSLAIFYMSSVSWAVAGWQNAHHFPPEPTLPLSPKLRYCLLFFGYVSCANLLALSAVPTLLLIMVFPLESISTIGLGCFGFLVFITPFVLIRSQDGQYPYSCFSILYMSMFVIVITSVLAVCVSILFIGSGTNEYFQAFLPALGSAVVGYWMKKTFFDKNKNKERDLQIID